MGTPVFGSAPRCPWSVHADFLVRPDARGERHGRRRCRRAARRRRRRRRVAQGAVRRHRPRVHHRLLSPASGPQERGRAAPELKSPPVAPASSPPPRGARSEPPVRRRRGLTPSRPLRVLPRCWSRTERRRRAGRRDAGQGPHRPHPGESPRPAGAAAAYVRGRVGLIPARSRARCGGKHGSLSTLGGRPPTRRGGRTFSKLCQKSTRYGHADTRACSARRRRMCSPAGRRRAAAALRGRPAGVRPRVKQHANRQMLCRLASAVALLAFLDMATAQFSLRAA